MGNALLQQGLPAASATTGCLMEDVETLAGSPSAAVVALEMVLDRVRPYGSKKYLSCWWVCTCQYSLFRVHLRGRHDCPTWAGLLKWAASAKLPDGSAPFELKHVALFVDLLQAKAALKQPDNKKGFQISSLWAKCREHVLTALLNAYRPVLMEQLRVLKADGYTEARALSIGRGGARLHDLVEECCHTVRMPLLMLEKVPHLSCELNGRLNVDHEGNGRKQDYWLHEWLGASEGDYFESKGAKRKKLTPEERKEEATNNGRLSQAAARRGEWTPNPSRAGGVTNVKAKTPKGASSAKRKEKGLLPAHIAPEQRLCFVGVCFCCGDKYLSNSTAKQCYAKADHNKAGKGLKPLTLDRKALSAKGERAREEKQQ